MLIGSRLYDEDATNGISTDQSVTTDSPELNSAGASDSSPPESALDATAGADSPDASAATAPVPSSFFDTVRTKHGVDLSQKYKTEDDAIKGLINAQQLVGRRDQYSELGRFYADKYEDFQEYLRTKQGGQAPQQQAQEPEDWWNPPQWNETWNKFLDPESRQPREDAPLNVKQAFHDREDYISRWQHELVFNPTKALQPLMSRMEQRLMQSFDQRYQQAVQANQINAEAQQLVEKNMDWMFQQNPDGSFPVDDQGRKLFTAAGMMMLEEVQELSRYNMPQKKVFEIAQIRVKDRMGGLAPSAAPVPQPAKHKPNTNGSANRRQPSVPDEAGLSLRERLMRQSENLPETAFA